MFYPSRSAFEQLAKDHTVIPVYRDIIADGLTPVLAFATVGNGPGSYLLESVVGGEKWGRYSFIGVRPDRMLRARDGYLEDEVAGKITKIATQQPWSEVRSRLSEYKPARVAQLPRFWGGAVGYVAYDAVKFFEPKAVGVRPPTQAPESFDFSFSLGGVVLIFDGLKQKVSVVATAHVPKGSDAGRVYDEAAARIDETIAELRNPPQLRELDIDGAGVTASLPTSSFSKSAFEKAVKKTQEYIHAGDVFQLVLSQQFTIPMDGTDAFDVYRVMRVLNPSPYMYYLNFKEVRVAGASPETLVRLEDGRAEVRPIAGTMPRGATEDEDARLEAHLLTDPKERAEHVMLVDLGRNDLGRVCDAGSVRVTETMSVEKYSHVMHIVSNVVGTLSKDKDAIDLLAATFPAGTLSGAPKVRAMQIIDELEPVPRGIYGGAVGYISFDGNMDAAIAIRTVTEAAGTFTVQAGAGIVEASVPEKEYEETLNKSGAARLAIELTRQKG